MSRSAARTRDVPARLVYDPSDARLQVVLDVLPTPADDLVVAVGTDRIRIEIVGPDRELERVVSPPSTDFVFTADRSAIYNNGVLSVTVGTTNRSREEA